MTAAEVVERLHGRRCGAGWLALCPAHPDTDPSLSIRVGVDGRVLLHCFVGCTYTSILAALGMSHLGPRGGREAPIHSRVRIPPPPPYRIANVWGEDTTPIPQPNRYGVPPAAKHVASYRYTNADGLMVGVVDRFDPKTFRPRLVWAHGWRSRIAPYSLPLYRLPDLLHRAEDAPVYLVEGERDVETMRARGYTATTAPGGAQGWTGGHTIQLLRATLPGDTIILCPDQDDAGAAWRATLLQHLGRTGRSLAEVRL